MNYSKQQLQESIKKMQEVMDKAGTSETVKEAIRPSLEKAKQLLKDLESKQPEEKPAPREVSQVVHKAAKKVKKGKQALAQAKQVHKKIKTKRTPQKVKHVKLTPAQKKTLREIVATTKKYAGYRGKSERELQLDSQRHAKKPGSRTSKSGKTYREYRLNRADVDSGSPHLEKGGKIMAKGGEVGYKMGKIYGNIKFPRWIKDEFYKYDLYVITKKYVYYNYEDGLLMYDKKMKLISDLSEFIQNDIIELMLNDKDIQWKSRMFKYNQRETIKEQKGNNSTAKGGTVVPGHGPKPIFISRAEGGVIERAKQYQKKDGDIVLGFQSSWNKGIGKYEGDPVIQFVDLSEIYPNHYSIYAGIYHDGELINVSADFHDTLFEDKEEALKVAEEMAADQNWGMEEYEEGGTLEQDEPNFQEDSFITDSPKTGYEVMYAGKFMGVTHEFDEAIELLNEQERKQNFFPNRWFITDHGNMWPIDHEGKEIKMKHGGVICHNVNTDVGAVQVYGASSFPMKKEITVYHAEKRKEHAIVSVSWIKNKIDADRLKGAGYTIQSLTVPVGKRPRNYYNGESTKIEVYESGGELATGTSQMTVYGYTTGNFTPAAKAAFEKAVEGLNREPDKQGAYYLKMQAQVGSMAILVDELLGNNLTDPTKAHYLLQKIGGLNHLGLVNTDFLNYTLTERKLEEGGELENDSTENAGEQYVVLSPDRITISMDETYPSKPAARKALKQWMKRYERQGYYSSVEYGRIPLKELEKYCKIIKAKDIFDQFNSGGRIKSALMRDRAYKSNEPHELRYHRKTRPRNPRYKLKKGGKTTFQDKAGAIAKNLKGKKVAPKYQSEYGKVYNRKSAQKAAKKIAGSIAKKE